MKVLAVSSFHISSTRDVWLKAIAGLEANGIEVLSFDMLPRYQIFSFLKNKMQRSKRELPEDWSPENLTYEVLLGAAVFHEVDAVLVVSPQCMPHEVPQMISRVGIKTVAMLTECPYEDSIHTPIVAANFDVTLVSDKHSVGLFESFCPKVLYVPHCYDPELHYPGSEDREENTVFVGTGYESRLNFMRDVEWPRRLDLYGWFPWQWMRRTPLLRAAIRGKTTPPQETAAIYRKSTTAFSLHRQQRYGGSKEAIIDGEAYSLGPRNWELAACKTFQVSDFRQELVDVFGDSVPLYSSPRELSALLRRAFDEPRWRDELVEEQWERAQPYSAQNVMRPVAQLLAA